MSLPPPLCASTFSALDDSPAEELAPLVGRASTEADAETLAALTGLLLDRALRLLREGSRDEILAEALAVSQGVSGQPGKTLRQRAPETYGSWAALADLLGEAARRSDRAAVPSLLRSTQGHGLAILELLKAEGRAVPRTELRRRLSLGEAHLSHLLRDLEEADLVLRYKAEGAREVLVELGPVGREVASQAILPPWLERLEEALHEIAVGTPLQAEALAAQLTEAGAPSRLAADRLARAALRFAPAETAPAQVPAAPPPASNILRFVHRAADRPEQGDYRLQEVLDRQDGARSAALFIAEEEPGLTASA